MDQGRRELQTVVKKLKGTSQKVRQAQILLKADADVLIMASMPRGERHCRTKSLHPGQYQLHSAKMLRI